MLFGIVSKRDSAFAIKETSGSSGRRKWNPQMCIQHEAKEGFHFLLPRNSFIHNPKGFQKYFFHPLIIG
jgi:hypothetical protein